MAKIYLADRDESYRKALAHELRRRGRDVAEFTSGADLYALAIAQKPDLVLIEVDLEDMDGFELFARLRGRRAPFPIAFVTAFDHPRVARVCQRRGALGYVCKAGSVERMADELDDLLEAAEEEGRMAEGLESPAGPAAEPALAPAEHPAPPPPQPRTQAARARALGSLALLLLAALLLGAAAARLAGASRQPQEGNRRGASEAAQVPPIPAPPTSGTAAAAPPKTPRGRPKRF